MVLLLPEGPEIPEQREAEPGNRSWVLESHWDRPADLLVGRVHVHRAEEVPRLLQR